MSKQFTKKEEEQMVKWILYIILIPIILIYLFFKYLIWIIKFLTGNDNNRIRYKLNLSVDEKEQLEKIDKMDGKEFEYFMHALLIKNGYNNVKVTKASGDHGADILGELNGVKYAFQCKRFDSKVGSKPIGEVLRGMNYYKYEKGIVITNNYYTKQAIDEAKVNNVELWDRDKVLELYRNVLKDNSENKNKNTHTNDFILGINKKRLAMFCFAAVIAGFLVFSVVNYIKDVKKDMRSDESRISVHDLSSDVYNIAKEVVDDKEFEIKSNSDGVEYIIKYNGYTAEHYDTAFKMEVFKVYNRIKDKELKYRTLLGYQDCENKKIVFTLKYNDKKSDYPNTIGNIVLKYSNENKWTSSFEEENAKTIVTQEKVERMQKNM